ncbi:MAG: hypothetical protein RX318_03905 [bacterium]|nr:hypothetical protein [bacterium]
MARNLTAGTLAELTKASVRPIVLVEITFASSTVRLWTGIGDLIWNSLTWQGVGHFGTISPIEETSDIRAAGLTLKLSGIPSSLISSALADVRRGKAVKVYLGFLSEAGAVIVDPYLAFSGRADVASIEEGGDTASISIQAESRLIDLERPRERRYDDEDQKIDYPDDKGFEFVPSLQDKSVVWGS